MKYFAFGLTIKTDINFDGILQKSTSETDVVISEDIVPERAERLTRLRRRGIQAKFGNTGTELVLNWPGIGKFKISDGRRIVYQNLGADVGTLRLFLLSEVIGIILYQRGLFLLHASTVKINNEAILFMGVSGAGKSTTATAFGQAGYTVLTDDLAPIKFIDSRPYLIPAFSQYKVWKSALNGLGVDSSTLEPSFDGADKFLITQPLHLFPTKPVLIRQLTIIFPEVSRVKERQIKPITAPVELLKHFPLPMQLLTLDFLQQHFIQSIQIAQSTPIYSMKRTKDFQALEKFVKEITREF